MKSNSPKEKTVKTIGELYTFFNLKMRKNIYARRSSIFLITKQTPTKIHITCLHSIVLALILM